MGTSSAEALSVVLSCRLQLVDGGKGMNFSAGGGGHQLPVLQVRRRRPGLRADLRGLRSLRRSSTRCCSRCRRGNALGPKVHRDQLSERLVPLLEANHGGACFRKPAAFCSGGSSDPFAGAHSRPRDANARTRNMPPHLRFQAKEVHCSPNPSMGVRAMSS